MPLFFPPFLSFAVRSSTTPPPTPLSPSSSSPHRVTGPPPPSPSSLHRAAGFPLHSESHRCATSSSLGSCLTSFVASPCCSTSPECHRRLGPPPPPSLCPPHHCTFFWVSPTDHHLARRHHGAPLVLAGHTLPSVSKPSRRERARRAHPIVVPRAVSPAGLGRQANAVCHSAAQHYVPGF
jgi:hypothetical protein